MKLLVFADSHNLAGNMINAASQHLDATACFFLGDGARTAPDLQTTFPQIPLYLVQGNSDFGSFAPIDGLAPFGGLLFFYTHGHKFGVKRGPDKLCLAAQRLGADVALFGHTHTPFYEQRNGVHLFCPGSISFPQKGPPSYGIITIDNGIPAFQICYL